VQPSNRHPSTLIAALAFLSALLAAAPSGADGLSIGGRAGTLGFGPEATFGVAETVHLRGGVFAGAYDDSLTERGIDYDADLELRHVTALVDWYPGGGFFRLSAGAAWNDSDLVGTAPLEDLLRREIPNLPPLSFDLGTLRGTATVDPVGPYVGVGFGNPFNGGRWGFTLDLGVVDYGEPDIDLVAVTQIPISLIPGGQAALDAALAEEEAALQDEVDGYRYLPVVSLGLTYSF
jgi:hypothetical protein